MKWFVAVLFALMLLLNYRIWLSPDGMSEVLRLKEAVAMQRAENERLKLRNLQLAAEVRDLKQGFGALEEQARSELGMIAANETYYQVVPASVPGATPAAPAAPVQPVDGDAVARTALR